MLYNYSKSFILNFFLFSILLTNINCKDNKNKDYSIKARTRESGIDTIIKNKYYKDYDDAVKEEKIHTSLQENFSKEISTNTLSDYEGSKKNFNNIVSKLIDKVESEDGTKRYYKLKRQSMLYIKKQYELLKFPLLKTRLLDTRFNYNNKRFQRHNLIDKLQILLHKLKDSLANIQEHPMRVLLLSKRMLRKEALLIHSIESDLKPSEQRARTTLYTNFETHLKVHMDLLEKLSELNITKKYDRIPMLYIYSHLDSRKDLDEKNVYTEEITGFDRELRENLGKNLYNLVKEKINRMEINKVDNYTKKIDFYIRDINTQLHAFEDEIKNRAKKIKEHTEKKKIQKRDTEKSTKVLNEYDRNYLDTIDKLTYSAKNEIEKIISSTKNEINQFKILNLTIKEKNLIKKKKESIKEQFHKIAETIRLKFIQSLTNINFEKGFELVSKLNKKIRYLRQSYLRPMLYMLNTYLGKKSSNEDFKDLDFDSETINIYDSYIQNRFNESKIMFKNILEADQKSLNKYFNESLNAKEIEFLQNKQKNLRNKFKKIFNNLRKEVKTRLATEKFQYGYKLLTSLNKKIKHFRQLVLRPYIRKIKRILEKNNIIDEGVGHQESVKDYVQITKKQVRELIHDSEKFIIQHKSEIKTYKNIAELEEEEKNLRNNFRHIAQNTRHKIKKYVHDPKTIQDVNTEIKNIRKTILKPHIKEIEKIIEDIKNKNNHSIDEVEFIKKQLKRFTKDVHELVINKKKELKEFDVTDIDEAEKKEIENMLKRLKQEFRLIVKHTNQKIRIGIIKINYEKRIDLLESVNDKIEKIKKLEYEPLIERIKKLLDKETHHIDEEKNIEKHRSKNYQNYIKKQIYRAQEQIQEIVEESEYEIRKIKSKSIEYNEIEELEDEKKKLKEEFQSIMNRLKSNISNKLQAETKNYRLKLIDELNDKISNIKKSYLRPILEKIDDIIQKSKKEKKDVPYKEIIKYKNFIKKEINRATTKVSTLIDENEKKLPMESKLNMHQIQVLENLKNILRGGFHKIMKNVRQKVREKIENVNYKERMSLIDNLNHNIKTIRKTSLRPLIVKINDIIDKNQNSYEKKIEDVKEIVKDHDAERIKKRSRHVINKINDEYLDKEIKNLENKIKNFKKKHEYTERQKVDEFAQNHKHLEKEIRKDINKIKNNIKNKIKDEHEFTKDDIMDHVHHRLNKFKDKHYFPLKHEIKKNIYRYKKEKNRNYKFKDTDKFINTFINEYKRTELPNIKKKIEQLTESIRKKIHNTNDTNGLKNIRESFVDKMKAIFRNSRQKVRHTLLSESDDIKYEVIEHINKEFRSLKRIYIRPLNERIRKKMELLLQNAKKLGYKKLHKHEIEKSLYEDDNYQKPLSRKYKDEFERYKEKLNKQRNIEKRELELRLKHADHTIAKESEIIRQCKKAKENERILLNEINKLKEQLIVQKNKSLIRQHIENKRKKILEYQDNYRRLNHRKMLMRKKRPCVFKRNFRYQYATPHCTRACMSQSPCHHIRYHSYIPKRELLVDQELSYD